MTTKTATFLQRRIAEPNKRNSLSSRCRTARFSEFLRRFPDLHNMRVLDLGGTPEFWSAVPVRLAFVTTMNLDERPSPPEAWLEHVTADACQLDSLSRCAGRYDVVFSNSLLAHVGGYERRQALAQVVRAGAPKHWVQTPDRYFPVEPHYVAPGFQFLPIKARAQLVSRWPLSHIHVESVVEVVDHLLMIELVSAAKLLQFISDVADMARKMDRFVEVARSREYELARKCPFLRRVSRRRQNQ